MIREWCLKGCGLKVIYSYTPLKTKKSVYECQECKTKYHKDKRKLTEIKT